MENRIDYYRHLFFQHLRPFLDMLAHQQGGMDPMEWCATVNRIASSVAGSPEQYLGKDLPNHEITGQILKEIFEAFIHEHPVVSEEILAM